MWTKTAIQRAIIHMRRPLGPMGEPADREAEAQNWATAAAGDPSAIAALVELVRDFPSADQLAALSKHVSVSDFQAELVYLLGLVGAAAPEAVLAAIGEIVDVPRARATAIEVLAEIGHPDGLRWLALLVDADLTDDEALWLASSLGEIGTLDAVPLLARLRAHTPAERSLVLREIALAEGNIARRQERG